MSKKHAQSYLVVAGEKGDAGFSNEHIQELFCFLCEAYGTRYLGAMLGLNPKLVDSRNHQYKSAVRVACELGDLETVKFLVERGADVKTGFLCASGNPTIVDFAPEIRRYVTVIGANVDEIRNLCREIYNASRYGKCFYCIEFLLESGMLRPRLLPPEYSRAENGLVREVYYALRTEDPSAIPSVIEKLMIFGFKCDSWTLTDLAMDNSDDLVALVMESGTEIDPSALNGNNLTDNPRAFRRLFSRGFDIRRLIPPMPKDKDTIVSLRAALGARAAEICIAFRGLGVPVLLILCIIEADIGYYTGLGSATMHETWQIAALVKHFVV